MTTSATQTRDEDQPDAQHDPGIAQWTPKILLGVDTLRQMFAESKRTGERRSSGRPASGERPS